MTTFCLYTGGESRMPLIYCFVYDVLSNAVPHTQQALTQLVDVIYTFVALQPRSYNQRGTYLGCLGGHWSGEMKSGVSWRKSAIVSRALCAGVLSCWNMKLCNLEWTTTIIVKYCWRRSCCHASRKYRVTISYSNRTAHLHTEHDRSVAWATHHRQFKFHKVVRQQT